MIYLYMITGGTQVQFKNRDKKTNKHKKSVLINKDYTI